MIRRRQEAIREVNEVMTTTKILRDHRLGSVGILFSRDPIIPQKRLQAQEETPRKQGETMCIIVFDVCITALFSRSLFLGFGVSSGEFRDGVRSPKIQAAPGKIDPKDLTMKMSMQPISLPRGSPIRSAPAKRVLSPMGT